MTTNLDVLVDSATSILRRRFPDLVSLDQPVVVKDNTRSVVLRMQDAASRVREFEPVTEAAERLSREFTRRGPEFQAFKDVMPFWPAFARQGKP